MMPPDITLNDSKGSTNVPMDSWIYPALERLGALGLIPMQSISIRPWTRQECLKQVKEFEESIDSYNRNDSAQQEGLRLLADLHAELEQPEDSNGIVLESAYTRYGVIAGPPLTDSFTSGRPGSMTSVGLCDKVEARSPGFLLAGSIADTSFMIGRSCSRHQKLLRLPLPKANSSIRSTIYLLKHR